MTKLQRTHKQQRHYLDHAASTPVDPRVLKAMLPYFSEDFANPGGLHKEAMTAKAAVASARESIARMLGSQSDEIIFTASGTESNNLAIFGALRHLEDQNIPLKDMHIVTTKIEHPSVLDGFKYLERRGVAVSYLSSDASGIVDIKELERALRPTTVLVSIMAVNNEIGTIEPLGLAAKVIRQYRKSEKNTQSKFGPYYPLLHTDASQAALFTDLTVAKLGVDLLSIDGQKVYGPKGVGALYKRRGVELTSLFIGGKQEFGLRAGTENVPGIVGFARALELAAAERDKEVARLTALRDYGIKQILAKIPEAELNGDLHHRLPNNMNISLPGYNSELLVLELDARGIAASTRSACLDPATSSAGSYVIEALGKTQTCAEGSLRFTLGRSSRKADIEYLIRMLVELTSKRKTTL